MIFLGSGFSGPISWRDEGRPRYSQEFRVRRRDVPMLPKLSTDYDAATHQQCQDSVRHDPARSTDSVPLRASRLFASSGVALAVGMVGRGFVGCDLASRRVSQPGRDYVRYRGMATVNIGRIRIIAGDHSRSGGGAGPFGPPPSESAFEGADFPFFESRQSGFLHEC